MKNWLKISLAAVGIVGACSVGLVGCGKKNEISSSEPVVFNGGIVSVVGDDIYFANAFSGDSITTMDDYKQRANSAYLASAKLSKLSQTYSSPEGVKNIKGEVTGHSNTYSFVYGNHVYYASPNKHKTTENQYVFDYVSFFRCGFDGSDEQELFTTKQYDSASAVVRALKYDGKGYLVVFDGTDLNVICLNDTKTTTVQSVTSVAVPREGDDWDGRIFYTANKTNAYAGGNDVFAYNVKTGEKTPMDNSAGYTVKFTGRDEDELFYSLTKASNNVTRTYVVDTDDLFGKDAKTFNSAGQFFYVAEISNIYSVGNDGMDKYDGYIFTSSVSGSAQVMYKADDAVDAQVVLESDAFTNVLFTYGESVYYQTSDGISFKSIATNNVVNVVEGMSAATNKVGWDYYSGGSLRNLYFYAQRVYAEDDETAEEDRDQTNYLYVVPADGSGSAKLVSQTIK